MSEKIISPGVFTRENDQSYLPTGMQQIGACIIGPTKMGPAFVPINCNGLDEYVKTFGDTDSYTYVPDTVRSYLKNAGSITVCRVLGSENWTYDNSYVIKINNTASAVLASTIHADYYNSAVPITNITGTKSEFYITFGGSFIPTTITASFDKTNEKYYIGRLFGTNPETKALSATDPNGNLKAFYLNSLFDLSTTGSITFVTSSLMAASTDYSPSSTPYVQSQEVSGQHYNLFKFITLSDGYSANKMYKMSITDIRKPDPATNDYGAFTVTVRDYNDTDKQPNILEQYAGCNLNVNSPNFIGRLIGTQYKIVNSITGKTTIIGDFPNKSSYIRIELISGIENLPNSLVPYGYAGYQYPFGISATNNGSYPSIDMTAPYTGSIYDKKIFYGANFDDKTKNIHQFTYYIPSSGSSIVEQTAFNLDDYNGHLFSGYTGSFSASYSELNTAGNAAYDQIKFTLAFQGGYDGMALNKYKSIPNQLSGDDWSETGNNANFFGFDCTNFDTNGTLAFNKAITIMSNPDEYDINMIILPGINQELHPYVTNKAITMCETRQDTFYIMDCTKLSTIGASTAVDKVAGLDTNYAATYYPWLKIVDPVSNKYKFVPPSTLMSGVIAFNDRVGAEWFAPAGLNRGGLSEAIQAADRLSQADRDILYTGRINPIASFPGQGITALGQKTLQKKASALDRINVRRLLIDIKKFCASTSKYLLFEMNTENTRNKFLSVVNPYLQSIQERQGLYGFKVIMDSSNNTSTIIDQNKLVGTILLQPTKVVEYIELTFTITPTGATFA